MQETPFQPAPEDLKKKADAIIERLPPAYQARLMKVIRERGGNSNRAGRRAMKAIIERGLREAARKEREYDLKRTHPREVEPTVYVGGDSF